MQPTVAVIGAGYWGPNLIRNFRNSPEWHLLAVCDLDLDRAAKAVGQQSTIELSDSVEAVLARADLDAIAIATPAHTHAPLALQAFAAGKHVLVEKPLAATVADGARMVAAARAAGKVLMADHTFCYTPSVSYIRRLIAEGELGDILYVDSTRINLGIVQPDVNVFWDLAPHDLSILDFILPGGLDVSGIRATGADPLNAGKECIGFAAMQLAGGGIAHINVNWLSPTKIRRFVVGGSAKTLVWDDVNPAQRISVFDRGVDVGFGPADLDERRNQRISYRAGGIVVPALPETEALGSMVAEFAAAIAQHRAPLTDGTAGLRVLAALDAIDQSLASGHPVTPHLEVT
ncbi:MAG: Gfo/Idh/MocA family protein [Arachnia sp.]